MSEKPRPRKRKRKSREKSWYEDEIHRDQIHSFRNLLRRAPDRLVERIIGNHKLGVRKTRSEIKTGRPERRAQARSSRREEQLSMRRAKWFSRWAFMNRPTQ